jgi:hypothetical protein
MNRREFVKYLTYAGLAFGTSGCLTQSATSSAEKTAAAVKPSLENAPNAPKLVVAEGTDPATLISRGLNALGGVEKFVRPGSLVVIKPNFSVPRDIEEAATTNPFLVAALIRACFAAQAKEVRVIDHKFNNGKICLEKSVIYQYVNEAVGK